MSQDRQQTTSGSSRKRLTSQEDRVAEKTKQHHLQQQQQQREEHLLLRDMKTRTKLVANLHSAANEGKVELVRLLLRCGADANAQDEQFGNTALHQAAWNGFSQTVQVLCKYRANTSVKNKAKFTPLHMASQQGHNQTARLLLMAGAKSEAKNSYGDTPLHTAARYGHAGVARILLSAKSDPNQVNKNHDTPLHIAAAMNRRKLTKIFMQNGAEPAIKNKQNETPMDIALRKDLIDIQELIANPPAANNAGQTTTGGRHSNHCHAHTQYSGLYGSPVGEQRGYGQLYGGRQSARHAHPAGRTRRTRRRNHGAHGGPSSDDSAASELEQRLARMRLHSGGAQNPSRMGRRLRAGDRSGTTNELAVDVPEELVRTGPLTRSAAFSSLHSIGAQATSAAHQQRRHGANHLRTQRATIGASSSGADLHLLPTLLSTRLHTTQRPRAGLFPNSTAATSRRRTTGSVDLEQPDADDADNEGCAPDARDNPADWADIMATSALYKRQQTVIEADDEIGGHDNVGKSLEASKSVGKEPSPNASFRSSLSKSRGRLLVRRRKQKASLLVRRPNLGTCVGKLSLVRLRAMVNKRSSPQRANNRSTSPDGAMGQPENEETIHSSKISSASKPVAAGRRQERLERLRDSGEQRAPNGIQLLATRPLAALGDTTQLYAIPKKNKSTVASKQQVADSKAAAAEAADRAAQLKQPPLSAVSDGGSPNGPALTSDGGHSSAGSSSSADMASSSDNIAAVSHLDIVCASNGKRSQLLGASLPATPPALVGVHGADRDLYASAAPGYSTVRELPLHNGAADNESSEPCLCHAGYQQQVGDKSCHLPDGSAPAAAAGTSSSSLQPASQPPPLPPQQQKQQQQQPQTTGEAKGRQQAEHQQQQQVAASKTSRLRQLLHLESRPKQDRCKANTTTASTVIITDEVHRPDATDVSSAPDGRLPMSAIAGGYYAYSPVVQSSSELKPAEQHLKQSGAGHESDKSNGSRSSGAKKSWLMSRFSLSSSTATLSNGSSHQVSSSNDLPNQQGITTHSQQQHLDTQVSNRTGEESALDGNAFASNALLGPERKAELITISSSDLTNRHLFHAPGEASTGHEHEQPVGRLIRPKSALSATSADLIAAQKSLATAAAAKVHRDRLVKLIDQNHQDEQQQQQQPDESTNKDGVLTVKTSEPFWSHLHHAQPVDAAAKYMIGQPMIATSGHHRSGTNSVGMSDSSPSNNGAESDNSIQTTSGSANTDTASQQNSNGQNPSPLGILSRILLNNKSLGYSSRQSAGNGSQSSQQVTDESSVKSSNESSTLRDNSATNGSISSSQSSPLSSNQSPGSSNGLADKPLAKLDQLASRSRRPIVMTSSNDSGNASEKKTQTARDAQSSPQNPPPLPAKGVLKTTGLKSINRINIGPSIISESALNGLPQVSPFSQQQQISNFANNNNKITADPQHQPLCNYHALGQPRANHLPHYAGPYSPYPTQTRYTFQEASQQKPLVGAKYAPHHLSHHELTTSPRSHDLTLPASAINYEYYLDSPLTAAYHQHLNQSSSAFQFGPEIGAPANNDNPIYSSYPQDYSIYVPHAIRPGGGGGDSGGGVSHSQTQTLDNSSQATGRFSS